MAKDTSKTVKHPVNFNQAEFDREQKIKTYYFAKWCAETNRHELFKEKYGMTLRQYKEAIDEAKQRKSKRS